MTVIDTSPELRQMLVDIHGHCRAFLWPPNADKKMNLDEGLKMSVFSQMFYLTWMTSLEEEGYLNIKFGRTDDTSAYTLTAKGVAELLKIDKTMKPILEVMK